jgi:hypothetical protein
MAANGYQIVPRKVKRHDRDVLGLTCVVPNNSIKIEAVQ